MADLTKRMVYKEQKKQLEVLMKDPEKPYVMPKPAEERKPREPREFIRNIWGSSAGVGSGDFDIYRGIRRRQMEREEYSQKMTEKDQLDAEYEAKRLENEDKAAATTAKKRAKRMKLKSKKVEVKKIRLDPSETEEGKAETKESHNQDSG